MIITGERYIKEIRKQLTEIELDETNICFAAIQFSLEALQGELSCNGQNQTRPSQLNMSQSL